MRAVYIAVCDDQIEELEKLTGLLEAWRTDRKANVRYQTFRSAAELLDAAQREGFTLYLLDVMMPGIGGMVRDAPRYSQTDVVVLGLFAIGLSGLLIDALLRTAENRLIPWRGRA